MNKKQLRRYRKTWWTAFKHNGKPTINTPERLEFTLRTNWRLYLVLPGWYHYYIPAAERNDWMHARATRLRKILDICYKHNLQDKIDYYRQLIGDHFYYTL